MEVIIKQENFSTVFNNVAEIASTKTSLPILSNVLLRTSGSQLLVAATDMEIAISQKVGAKVEHHGEIAIPADTVKDFISALPKGNISIKTKGEDIFIESGEYKSKIKGFFAEDFPEIPTVDYEGAKKITFKVDDFKQAVAQTAITAGTDTSRPSLMGIYIHTFEGNLYFAATDGYRLSEKRVFGCEEEISAIVSVGVIQKVIRNISSQTEEIEVLLDENQIEFHIDDVMIVSRLIDGKFPDYRRLIPSDTETKLEVSKSDFSRIVKIAELFAKKSGESVRLETDSENSKLTTYSVASEFGENNSSIDAEIFGEDASVSLNPRYLLDAIKSVSGEDIHFGFSGKLAPTVLKNPADDTYIHIVMPLKS